jgi:hypothetical protein
MTEVALRAAIAAVRGWTKLYTWNLPEEQRDARRGEIDSDLWESVNDAAADRGSLALHIAARLIAGIPDDLGWRRECAATAAAWRWRVALTVIAVAILGLWLVGERTTSAQLPDVPESLRISPHGVRYIDAPTPPPPPPPPCPPPAFPQPPGRCSR